MPYKDPAAARASARRSYYRNHEKELLRKKDRNRTGDYARLKADPVRYARMRQQVRDSKANARTAVLAMYGAKCACCGESRLIFLAIDHVKGGGGQHRREMCAGRFYRWLVKLGRPRKWFRILCHNCNFAYHFNNGVCPHTTKIAEA